FFDDFTVEHAHSAIVQADDYYPFGLSFNSYRREDGTMNRYKFNGKEEQEETNWLDYGRRMSQPEMGRFFLEAWFAAKYCPMSPQPTSFAARSREKCDFIANKPI